ncbi:hypothetical protein NDN08_005146 [Rhodosorus marinus]|uniref:Pentacotripeptide-repeat region of PRORP domain-containing protein n=1 Tax=Rhodosorus marinus TaxID=101924 RepID=A0AAV8V442_9RHOD|nr:hypothetical protein NDN08_005146 [Rhodosorus marinus]
MRICLLLEARLRLLRGADFSRRFYRRERDKDFRRNPPSSVDRREFEVLRKEELIQAHKIKSRGRLLGMKEATEEIRRLKDSGEQMLTEIEMKRLGLSLAGHGAIERFPEIFEALEARNLKPTADLYACFMKACLAAGAPAEVLTVFQDFKQARVPYSKPLIDTLLKVFGATNDLEEVESLHNELQNKSVRLDRGSTNILLKAYVRAGSIERCLEEYHKLQGQSSFIPNSETYSILISEHLALGNRDEAENLLHEQRIKNIGVHYNTFSAFVRYYASSQQFYLAEKTIKSMRESGFEPRKDVYHHMIVSHSRCGNLQQAMTWFHGMKSAHELSSAEYSILLSLVAKMRNLRLFIAMINSIEEENIEKSGYMYATMIRTFSRARRLDLAAEAFEEMRQRKLADSAGYNVFIDAVCTQETPDFARARGLMTDMVDQGVPPTSTTYGTVIHHLSRRGHSEAAVQMFEEMITRGLPPTVITYTQVMRALIRGDEPLKAIAYWERMKRKGIKPNAITYVIGIAAHCRAGELDTAYQILADQIAANITPLSGCFHALMQAETKRGNMEKTMDLYKRLMESNVEPNLAIFEVMLRMLLRLGEVGEVELLFETMKKFELRPPKWALIMLFKRLALDAELPKMLGTLDMFIERRIPISAGINHGMKLISFELSQDKEMANEFRQKLQVLQSNPQESSQKGHRSQRTSRPRQLEVGPAQHMNQAS